MNESERTVYGIYMITSSLEGRNASYIVSFKSSESTTVPMVVDILKRVGAHEIADLMKATRRLQKLLRMMKKMMKMIQKWEIIQDNIIFQILQMNL